MKSNNKKLDIDNVDSSQFKRVITFFYDNISVILVCNFLTFIMSFTIIASGPAFIALNKIGNSAVRGKKTSIKEYFVSFKANFKIGLFASFIVLPLFIATICNLMVSLYLFAESSNQLWKFVFFSVAFVVLSCYISFLFPLLATMKSSLRETIKTALGLCFAKPKITLIATFLTSLSVISALIFLPESLPFIAMTHLGVSIFFVNYTIWSVLDENVFKPYYECYPERKEIDNY